MKVVDLASGLPGHPTHPPLTDAVIGLYTGAAAFGVLSALGVSEENTAIGWWLTLVVGLVVTVPTAGTGLLDWLKISRGTPLWRTATAHLVAMLSASVLFLLAAVVGHSGYVEQEVTTSGLVLTLAGFALLTLGGWLGGTVVFVHGMRVLNLVDEPTHRAVVPIAAPEKKRAAGGGEDEEERGGLTRY
jgi:uncharacterized membrane protein